VKPTHLNLNRLVDFAKHIEDDSGSSLVDLQKRDRKIGMSNKQGAKLHKLLWWLCKMDENKPDHHKHESLQHVELSISFWMSILGILAGIITMSGLLLVENQGPVNVLVFLTLFLGSQVLLILITLLLVLTPRSDTRRAYLPFKNINPARILFNRAARRLSKGVRWEYFSELNRIALLRWGQVFGVAFNCGGIIAFIIILLFTDRSFGWSSTLNLSDTALLSFTEFVSLPWKAYWPEALISPEILSETRYQSLQKDFSVGQLQSMRQWWPFLLGCIVTYGLLPRIILFLIFHIQYRKALVSAFFRYPGARLIVDRMESPFVATQAENTQSHEPIVSNKNIAIKLSSLNSPDLINWTEAIKTKDSKDFLRTLGIHANKVFLAGLSVVQNKKVLAEINENSDEQKNIVVAVKSWEPPLEELDDFLIELSPEINCEILLVPLAGKQIRNSELADWQAFIGDKHRIKLLLAGDTETNEQSQKKSEENL